MCFGLWEDNIVPFYRRACSLSEHLSVKIISQFRSIEQDRYNLCIEHFEKHGDVKASNITQHFKDFVRFPVLTSRQSLGCDLTYTVLLSVQQHHGHTAAVLQRSERVHPASHRPQPQPRGPGHPLLHPGYTLQQGAGTAGGRGPGPSTVLPGREVELCRVPGPQGASTVHPAASAARRHFRQRLFFSGAASQGECFVVVIVLKCCQHFRQRLSFSGAASQGECRGGVVVIVLKCCRQFRQRLFFPGAASQGECCGRVVVVSSSSLSVVGTFGNVCSFLVLRRKVSALSSSSSSSVVGTFGNVCSFLVLRHKGSVVVVLSSSSF